MTSERWTYMNGEWLPDSKAKISVYDSQFMYGDAVFEMHRTFNHSHFLLDEHIERLMVSMRYMQIPITKTHSEIRDICDEAIERNGFPKGEEYRFMINVSRGPLEIYREVFELDKGEAWNEPTWIVNVWPLSKTTKRLAHFYDEPADACVTVQRQISAQFLEAKVKNRSRMHYKLADLEMKGRGSKAVPLLLDQDGFVAESSGANFMIVKDGKLIVPELRNMLRGCSMMFLLKLCDEWGIPVVSKNFEPYDVLTADEAMFTGTFNNLIPCNKLNGQRFGVPDGSLDENSMGPVTRRLKDAWNKAIRTLGSDFYTSDFCFVKQIRDWAKEGIEE